MQHVFCTNYKHPSDISKAGSWQHISFISLQPGNKTSKVQKCSSRYFSERQDKRGALKQPRRMYQPALFKLADSTTAQHFHEDGWFHSKFSSRWTHNYKRFIFLMVWVGCADACSSVALSLPPHFTGTTLSLCRSKAVSVKPHTSLLLEWSSQRGYEEGIMHMRKTNAVPTLKMTLWEWMRWAL